MKKLSFVLFMFVLLVSCKDNPASAEKEFEPYKNGNWLVVSEYKAQLTVSPKKADTTHIDDLNDLNFTLWADSSQTHEGGSHPTYFQFVDSSITDRYERVDIFIPNNDNGRILVERSSASIGDTFYRGEYFIAFGCWVGSDGFGVENVYLSAYNEADSLLKVYEVNTSGFVKTIKDINNKCY